MVTSDRTYLFTFPPSPKYTGLRDEAPRFMGDGFIVAQSNHLDIYYYQDEPGKVPVTTSADTGLPISAIFFCVLFVKNHLFARQLPLIVKTLKTQKLILTIYKKPTE